MYYSTSRQVSTPSPESSKAAKNQKNDPKQNSKNDPKQNQISEKK
jgi:hypothetical protein